MSRPGSRPDGRKVHFVPTGRAEVDRGSMAALERVGATLSAGEADMVVALLPSGDAARRRLPLLTLALGEGSRLRRLDLAGIAAAGRSVTVSLVAVDTDGVARTLVTGAVKAVSVSPHATLRRVLETCADWPARALVHGGPDQPAAHLGSGTLLAGLTLPMSLARNVFGWVREAVTEEVWVVGVVARPVASFLDRPQLDDVTWLPERAGGGFLADPFGLMTEAGPVVLAEAFVPELGRGEIVALRPGVEGSTTVATGLKGHLSYPCLIEDGGELYCLPENSAAGRVTLLRCVRFPDRFEPASVLLEGFPGVDCTPFRHDGRWWMLAMDHRDQDIAKLFLFHADRLRGPWQPHPWNPVRCDIRNARPAGPPFLHEGRLYRPTQDCSRCYGGAVVLNRIDVLTTEWFHETPVARIEPDPIGSYPAGVHTLTPLGATHTLLDAKRTRLRRLR